MGPKRGRGSRGGARGAGRGGGRSAVQIGYGNLPARYSECDFRLFEKAIRNHDCITTMN